MPPSGMQTSAHLYLRWSAQWCGNMDSTATQQFSKTPEYRVGSFAGVSISPKHAAQGSNDT